jgi:hypothetical protein
MTSWGKGYKGHHIQGTIVEGTEKIRVLLNDREGPGHTAVNCKTLASAKRRITMHVNRKGYSLCEFIRTTAWRMRDCNIEVDELHSTVAIGENCFMQGQEADEFVDEARALYDKAQHVSLDDCYACLAEPYAECLEN